MIDKFLPRKKYVSPNKIFILRYPFSWTMDFDPKDKQGSTVMFYKKNGNGTLRVTAISAFGKNSDTKKIMLEDKKKYPNSKMYKQGDKLILYYANKPETDKTILAHFWHVAKDNKVIIFSFTVGRKDYTKPEVLAEVKIVEEIINSVSF